MADQGQSDVYEPLRTWIKIDVNKFAISAHMALKLRRQALKSYLKTTCKFLLYILPIKKGSTAIDYG